VYSMIKETEPVNKAVVLYTIDTEYKVGIRIITESEFIKMVRGA